MRINLRKANKIKEELLAVINKISLQVRVTFDEHRKPDVVIEQSRSELSADVDRKLQLFEVMYGIREQVAKANFESGIDKVLTEIALIEKKIAILKPFDDIKKPADIDVICSKIESTKNRKDESLYRVNNDIADVVPSQEMLEKFHSQLRADKLLKKAKEEELLSLNVTTEIELSELAVTLLKREGIV